MNKEEQNLNNTENPKLGISDVSSSSNFDEDVIKWAKILCEFEDENN